MKPNFTLTIPNPCHENLKDFAPTERGGFCASCQKEVIDFTQRTDSSIIQYFEKAEIKACGSPHGGYGGGCGESFPDSSVYFN